MPRWYAPVDPECPEVEKHHTTLFEDPMTQHYGIGDEVAEGWEGKHRLDCERCQEYGAANIEVV
jgi:hypothetical protein